MPKIVRIYKTQEEICRELQEITGQNFEEDVDAWETWLRKNRSTFLELVKKYQIEKAKAAIKDDKQ
ncbi:MAG: hypothetical protein AAFR56_15815 [Chloroflexota bacterium]